MLLSASTTIQARLQQNQERGTRRLAPQSLVLTNRMTSTVSWLESRPIGPRNRLSSSRDINWRYKHFRGVRCLETGRTSSSIDCLASNLPTHTDSLSPAYLFSFMMSSLGSSLKGVAKGAVSMVKDDAKIQDLKKSTVEPTKSSTMTTDFGVKVSDTDHWYAACSPVPVLLCSAYFIPVPCVSGSMSRAVLQLALRCSKTTLAGRRSTGSIMSGFLSALSMRGGQGLMGTSRCLTTGRRSILWHLS